MRPLLTRYLPELVVVALVGSLVTATVVAYAFVGISPLLSIGADLATLASVSIYFAVRRSGEDWHRELRMVFAVSLILALIVVFAGYVATDEGRTTVAYGQEIVAGLNPYTHLLNFTYPVTFFGFWSTTASSTSYDTYLPLVGFVQIPGTGPAGYALLGIGCWAGMVYLVRRDEFAALTLASPVVALIAATGFNDIPILFLMTLSLRGWSGTKSTVVEYLSYGMKQFANAFWIVFYLLQRQWVKAVIVVAVTGVIVAPFLFWQPSTASGGIYCQALTFGWGPGCPSIGARGVNDLWQHWNYYVWPVWVYALFRDGIHRRLRGLRARWSARRPARSDVGDAAPVAEEVPLRTNGY